MELLQLEFQRKSAVLNCLDIGSVMHRFVFAECSLAFRIFDEVLLDASQPNAG